MSDSDTDSNRTNLNRLQQYLLEVKSYFHKLEEQGGYSNEPIKVNKPEERDGEWAFFSKQNKELILDNKLFSDRIYKQKDVAFLKNPFHNLIRKNAVISQRLNQRKNNLRLLNLDLNWLMITEHPSFIDEDRKMSILREKMKSYNR